MTDNDIKGHFRRISHYRRIINEDLTRKKKKSLMRTAIGPRQPIIQEVDLDRTRKRDSFIKIFTLLTVIAAIISSYILQRNGFLLQGQSWHLKHHHKDSMIKKALLFRNLMFSMYHHEEKRYLDTDISDARFIQRAVPFVNKDFFEIIHNITEYKSAVHNWKHPTTSTTTDQSKRNESAYNILNYIDESIQKVYPSHLLDEGLITPFVDLGNGSSLFSPYLNHMGNNTLFIIFPGIMAEFINVGPFEELFKFGEGGNNILSEEFKSNLESHPKKSDTTDKMFSSDKLSPLQIPLDDLIEVASVGVKELTRAFDIFRFTAVMGSLETLGTVESTMECYMRRLDKYFRVMQSVPENIHFIGYSRGALVALETLVRCRARIKQHSWCRYVKSVISLGGVLWGTEVADTTQMKGHTNNIAKDIILNCGQTLNYHHFGDGGSVGHAKEVINNSKLMLDSLMLLAASDLSVHHPEMDEEFTSAPTMEVGGMAKLAYEFLFAHFHMDEPVKDYYGNIKKLKILVNSLVEGIEGLTTKSRMRWWSKNVIPVDVRYYALAGTMTDADTSSVESDVSFSTSSMDFRVNRQFFYEMYKHTGKMLNDGQMAVDRANYWPAMHMLLNPKQKEYWGTMLGVVNAHHWGLALPSALDNPDTMINNFPRSTMMKALAALLSRDVDDMNQSGIAALKGLF